MESQVHNRSRHLSVTPPTRQLSDFYEYWNGSMLTWRLTPSEVRKILALRVDFNRDEVNRMKL